ncbi:6-phosphogluconolactonase, DevB-type [Cynara cardunculus var. scolymus]|uniref:6-phosphogluconolactonase n=2 Tax=Cynara cardunculus var. scolymus TaxID=59895 RepID=A0A103Y2I3_CYNCS|nr:6-phosphogluconolactonase, DevB-type [Cynara cardunculus var. scolymus]
MAPPTPLIQTFETEEQVAVALAIYILHLSAKFIADNGSFSVVLSGGTLIDTLRKLVEPPYVDSIEWSKWTIFFLDERVVPLDHPDSNYKLAYDGFLSKVPIPESNIYPIKDKLSPSDAADEYEQRLKHLVANNTLKTSPKTGFAKFDLMLVGMGPEGHVASLFGWHFQRFEKTRWVTFITDSPKPPPPRITFTFPLINSASEIAMVVTGEDAADAVKVALGKHASYGYPLPVQKVSPEGGLTWFLDMAATSELRKTDTVFVYMLFHSMESKTILGIKNLETRGQPPLRTLTTMAPLNIQKLQTEEHVAVALAKYIADLSAKFIDAHGSFSVVLSGGTLIDTLRKVVEPPYVNSIDWSKWLIFFLDERVVPLDHPDCNYKLAYDGFLSKVPIPESNIYPIKERLSPEDAADEYEQRLKNLVANKTLKTSPITGFAKFDLMLVGMGPDGHVASLFCWHFQRFEKKRWVTFITDSPKPPPPRITFTFPLINSASEIAMVVTGEDAADAVKVALGKHASYGYPLPVQKVSPEGGLTWFLDTEATSELK